MGWKEGGSKGGLPPLGDFFETDAAARPHTPLDTRTPSAETCHHESIKSRTPAMTLDDALARLSVFSPDLPREALGWCLEHWDEAGPCLLERLARYADGADRSKENESILFFALHLMAEASEARAFAPLCRLARDNETIETVLGDAVTETLKQILISVFDGDDATLKDLIEDPEAGGSVRSAAFDALAYLTATGRIARDTVVPWLAGLTETLRAEKPEDMVWMAWTDAIALLGLEDLTPLVKAAFDDDLIDPMWTDFDGFEEMMARTLADPERMALFAREHIHPFTDTIGEMSEWYCFSEQRKEDEKRRAERARQPPPLARPPRANPHKNVGRNDPCPCGSGKKYKKCCLG